MMDLHYRFTGIDSVELFPETLTHLYLDRPLEIYGRFYGDPPLTAFQVIGTSEDGEKDFVFGIDWGKTEAGEPGIRTRWAYHKAYTLIGKYIETRQESILNRMHLLADRYGLLIPYGRDVVYW